MGHSEHSLDDKGRVIIPSKFRDAIDSAQDGTGFVITPAPEQCLFLYTPAEWSRICDAQRKLPKGSPEYRQFQRLWYANAEQGALDKQGRLLLPERLRSLVNIEGEIVIAGCYDRLEIWAKPAWESAQSAARGSYASQVQAFLGAVETE